MISLLFSRGADLGAKLIEFYGHGAWSHVDSVLSTGRLLGARSDSVGGAPPGVQIRDPSYLDGEVVLRVNLDVDQATTDAYYGFLQSQVGKPYDGTAILAFAAGRDWQAPDSWFCSELVAAGLQLCGYFPYPLATPANKITPPDLLLTLSVLVPIQ